MSDEAAIELGAEIVAVTLTCFISFTAIIMQQSISAATEKKKAEAEENVLQRIEKNQLELHRKVFDLHTVDQFKRKIHSLFVERPVY